MKKPEVGMYINDPGLGRCLIVRVHAAGTVDIKTEKGGFYRMSGLPFVDEAVGIRHGKPNPANRGSDFS